MPDRGGIDEGLQQLETGFDATAHPQRCSGAVPRLGRPTRSGWWRIATSRVMGFEIIGTAPRTVRPGPATRTRSWFLGTQSPFGRARSGRPSASLTDSTQTVEFGRPAAGGPVADSGSIAVHFASVTEDSRSIGTHQVADECGSSSSSRILVALRVVG